MKLGWYIGFGFGMAAGVLLMNNFKKVRSGVSAVQDTVIQKLERKTTKKTSPEKGVRIGAAHNDRAKNADYSRAN
jgi:hypothetical protein